MSTKNYIITKYIIELSMHVLVCVCVCCIYRIFVVATPFAITPLNTQTPSFDISLNYK